MWCLFVSLRFVSFPFTMAFNGASALPQTMVFSSASALPQAMAPPLPVLLMPEPSIVELAPTPLVRQIREDYWEDTEKYMQENPNVQECEVLTSNYQWGWVHKVVRAADGSLQRITKYETCRDDRHPDFKEPSE